LADIESESRRDEQRDVARPSLMRAEFDGPSSASDGPNLETHLTIAFAIETNTPT